MSDLNDYFNQSNGFNSALGNIAAINQRSRLLTAQREQIAALERQTAGIQDLQRTEAARLELEQQRLQLEANERSLHKEQLEKLKEIRNFMADTAFAFEQLKKQYT